MRLIARLIAAKKSSNKGLQKMEYMSPAVLTMDYYRLTTYSPCLLYLAEPATNVVMLATTRRFAHPLSAFAITVSGLFSLINQAVH
jgi:hypothetical protein